MIWFWPALSFLAVIFIVRRVGFLSVGGVFAATCLMSQVTILLVSVLDVGYLTNSSWISFRPTGAEDAREIANEFYFLMVATTCVAVTVPNLPSLARNEFESLHRAITDRQAQWIKAILWISFSLNLLHLLVIDREKIWSASGYQIMKDPEQMGFGAALLPLFLLPRLTGVLAIVGLVIFARRRELLPTAVSSLTFIYSFLLSLAQNSRLASLYLLAALAANALIGRRLFTLVNAALLVFSMVTAISVLKGRHDPTQGLGHAVSQLFSIDFDGSDVLGLYLNLNAGGLITTDSIVTNADYRDKYKVLSFSPFPSLIDGFSEIREQEERRINYFTPINAFGEVYLFGGAYIAIFLASIYMWIRSAAVASTRLGVRFSAVITLLAILSTVTLQQYSLRTGFRFILLSTVVCYIAMWFSKRSSTGYLSRAPGQADPSDRMVGNARLNSRGRTA